VTVAASDANKLFTTVYASCFRVCTDIQRRRKKQTDRERDRQTDRHRLIVC